MKIYRSYLAALGLVALPAIAIGGLQSSGFHGSDALAGLSGLVSKAVGIASAQAAVSSKADAHLLLDNMRSALAKVAASYRDSSGAPAHRSGRAVLASVSETARALEKLETAIGSRNPGRVAEATKSTARAIGRLQSAYAVVPSRNAAASKGMRALNTNWKTYSARYILSNRSSDRKPVSTAEVRALKKKVKNLTQRVSSLERQVARNETLSREVARLRADLVYFDSRPDDLYAYRALLLTLSMTSGAFDALTLATKDYYPGYYAYFQPIVPEVDVWGGYWTGYYDAYYDGAGWDWYQEPFIAQDVVLLPEADFAAYQDATYETIIESSNASMIEYDALPVEDLSEAVVPALPDDIEFTAETLQDIDAASYDAAEPDLPIAEGIEPDGWPTGTTDPDPEPLGTEEMAGPDTIPAPGPDQQDHMAVPSHDELQPGDQAPAEDDIDLDCGATTEKCSQ